MLRGDSRRTGSGGATATSTLVRFVARCQTFPHHPNDLPHRHWQNATCLSIKPFARHLSAGAHRLLRWRDGTTDIFAQRGYFYYIRGRQSVFFPAGGVFLAALPNFLDFSRALSATWYVLCRAWTQGAPRPGAYRATAAAARVFPQVTVYFDPLPFPQVPAALHSWGLLRRGST